MSMNGKFIRRFQSISKAAEYMSAIHPEKKTQQRKKISESCTFGTTWKLHRFEYATKEAPTLQKTVSDTNWEENFNRGDFATVIRRAPAPPRNAAINLFIDSEHCQRNVPPGPKRVKRSTDVYTSGVEEDLLCFGHKVTSTVVFPVGCSCTIKQPHCLQCVTTNIDSHKNGKCFLCNTPYTGLSFTN